MQSKLYFVDGYHGGIEGHMPVGSWEDILDALKRHPEWKISLEVEPESWAHLKIYDYNVYKRLQAFTVDSKDRVEFISGSFAQPFCWAINGESNIRQLTRGIEVTNQHFPNAVIDTYAVQEPCFTSMLPQICKKLGFKRMSLKNPTSWGGYMAKMPGAIVNLYSADGSSLPAVPRYDCEELVSCSATEAAGYDYTSIKGFAAKCIANGIQHPIGMCLQDLGWGARPLIQGIPVEYVTWREYFQRFASDLEGDVLFSQDAILCHLPWGNLTLQQMCRNIRALENRVLQMEKLVALAEVAGHDMASSKEKLQAAWDQLLLVQHHDGYICATTPGSTYKGWASRADYLTKHGQNLLDEIKMNIFDAMQETGDSSSRGERYIRVYNTTGIKQTGIVEAVVTLPSGYYSLSVCDGDNNVVSQFEVIRKHADESIAAAKVLFNAEVEGVGYSTYLMKASESTNREERHIARQTIQDTVVVETSLLNIVFGLTKGGSIISLYDKQLNRELVVDEPIGVLKGYSIKEDGFISNEATKVKSKILVNGPIYTKIKFSGSFSGLRFETTVEIRENDKKIDVTSNVFFAEKTEIGYPLLPEKDKEYHGTKRSSAREDYKLAVRMPLPMKDFAIYKSAPYEDYQSEVYDTRFGGWDEIKNNILNGYIDFYDRENDCGLAFICDHITGYSLVDNQFSITQAFGYHAGFWWGNQPLVGASEIKYSIISHKGDYEGGQVFGHVQRNNEPFVTQILYGKPEVARKSIFCFEDTALELVTVLSHGGKYAVRACNHSKSGKAVKYTNSIPALLNKKADLYGNNAADNADTAASMEILTIV